MIDHWSVYLCCNKPMATNGYKISSKKKETGQNFLIYYIEFYHSTMCYFRQTSLFKFFEGHQQKNPLVAKM